MKLLIKTARSYLILSGSIFIVAGLLIYMAISFYFDEQLNEKLESNRIAVIQNIEKSGSLSDFYPFIEVKKIADQAKKHLSKDTLLFNSDEKELIAYRQIISIERINGNTYQVTVRDTLIEKSDMILTIGLAIGFIFILLNISLYFITIKLSKKTWEPFYYMLNRLKGFSYEDPDFKISISTGIDEFVELNNSLGNLTSKVLSDYQVLKRFSEDASHEIQTPLAIIQSKIETLMQHPGLRKEQVSLVKAAYSSVLQISKLTQALILLTKISNNQFPEKADVNLSQLLETTIKLFEEPINARSLRYEMEIENGCIIHANLFLVESIILNLIGNSVKYCISDGKIKIKLFQGLLEVSNSGHPFQIQTDKLFERFYKVNASSESQGLGLAIVKEICHINNWEISYLYEDKLHRFIIRF